MDFCDDGRQDADAEKDREPGTSAFQHDPKRVSDCGSDCHFSIPTSDLGISILQVARPGGPAEGSLALASRPGPRAGPAANAYESPRAIFDTGAEQPASDAAQATPAPGHRLKEFHGWNSRRLSLVLNAASLTPDFSKERDTSF